MADKEKWLRKFEQANSDFNINIFGNLGSTIKDNKIIVNINPVVLSDPQDDTVLNGSNSFSSLILPQKQINKNTFDRQHNWNIFLEQILEIIKHTHEQPTLRLLQLYSGFCCFWEESNRNDIAMLELQERKILISLIKAGCRIKILVNLDVDKAFACGFSKSDLHTRVADLCTVCDMLSSYRNFQLAIDDREVAYEPSVMFEDIVMTQNYNFHTWEQEQEKYKGNYARSVWHSDREKILSSCYQFDELFKKSYIQNITLMRALHLHSLSELIWYIVSERIKEYESFS